MDIEWDPALAVKYKRRMSQIVQLAGEMLNISSDEEKPIDKWIISRLNHRINTVTNLMDDYKIRDASIEIFYETYSDINWWLRRGGSNKEVALQILGCWVRMMSPFTPHLAEELYQKVSGLHVFVSLADYPEFDKNSINRKAEIEEEMLKELIDNLRNILELTKRKPNKIHLYIAPEWMRELYNAISGDMKMSELMKNPDMRAHGAEIAGIMKKTFKTNIPDVVLTLEEEYGALTDAKEFIEKEFGCGFEIQKEVTYDPEKKSVYSRPMKQGIFIE
jgi:leucyl-tRNA synthetase